MKKFWIFIGLFVSMALTYIIYTLKKANDLDTSDLEMKMSENNIKLRKLRRNRVADKKFHDLTDSGLVDTFQRLRKRYKNKQR